MVDPAKNYRDNRELEKLYEVYTPRLLALYRTAFPQDADPPGRVNLFGILDESLYDGDNGILFVMRDTNGWENAHFENGTLFRPWAADLARTGIAGKGHVSEHPNLWYNLRRWTTLILAPDADLLELAEQKVEVLPALRRTAITNINKVRGENYARASYRKFAASPDAQAVLRREIELLSPKYLVCCGTSDVVHASIKGLSSPPPVLIDMPHPASRKGTLAMLRMLREQLL